ncbi:MAG: hypothetical protein HOP07_06465 [Bacteriovoracaceae bacterium]|nr:hypothetical protein [Bacteriovoracaceae bacterium]
MCSEGKIVVKDFEKHSRGSELICPASNINGFEVPEIVGNNSDVSVDKLVNGVKYNANFRCTYTKTGGSFQITSEEKHDDAYYAHWFAEAGHEGINSIYIQILNRDWTAEEKNYWIELFKNKRLPLKEGDYKGQKVLDIDKVRALIKKLNPGETEVEVVKKSNLTIWEAEEERRRKLAEKYEYGENYDLEGKQGIQAAPGVMLSFGKSYVQSKGMYEQAKRYFPDYEKRVKEVEDEIKKSQAVIDNPKSAADQIQNAKEQINSASVRLEAAKKSLEDAQYWLKRHSDDKDEMARKLREYNTQYNLGLNLDSLL